MQYVSVTEEAIQDETFDYQDDGLTRTIKKKYLWAMILIIGIAAFLPSYFQGTAIRISYVFLAQLLGSCYTMYQNLYYFQQFSFKHRPLLMTKYFQLIAVAGFVALLIYSIPIAEESGLWTAYIMLRVIAGLIPLQFFEIFKIAKRDRSENPSHFHVE